MGLVRFGCGRWPIGCALARASGAAFLARCTSEDCGWRGALAAGAAAGAGAGGAAAGGGAVIAAENAPASKLIVGIGAAEEAGTEGATLTRAGGGASGAFEALTRRAGPRPDAHDLLLVRFSFIAGIKIALGRFLTVKCRR